MCSEHGVGIYMVISVSLLFSGEHTIGSEPGVGIYMDIPVSLLVENLE